MSANYFHTSVFRSCTLLKLLEVQGSTVSTVMRSM